MADPPLRLLAKAWSSTGPLIAVLASGVALVFTLDPGLAPDPGTGLVASAAVQTVQRGVVLKDFDAQFAPANLKADTAAGAAADAGDVVWVRFNVKGQKHGHVNIYAVPYDWRTRRVTYVPLAVFQTSRNAKGFDPGTPDDQWIAPLWVPDPQTPHFIRVMVEHQRVILAYVDTGRIAG